jgi:pimeloyl-ACP methyl ester carboxylesterase
LLTRPKPAPPSPPAPTPQPLPGQKVDVGGYRLYLDCTGTQTPTVIFEAGTGSGGATNAVPAWRSIRSSLAAETRVCDYDRAGLGESDKRPSGVAATGAQYATELHALLAAANVPGPYVLAGASSGGLFVMSHAIRYPEYAGLVFLDSDNPCGTACARDPAEPADFGDLGSPMFGDRPLVVLTAGLTDGPNLARRSTNRILASAPGSSHFILADRPELVLQAIRLVVGAVRAQTRLPACEQTPLPAAGGLCEAA